MLSVTVYGYHLLEGILFSRQSFVHVCSSLLSAAQITKANGGDIVTARDGLHSSENHGGGMVTTPPQCVDSVSLAKNSFEILLGGCDQLQIKVVLEYLEYVGGDEGGSTRTQANSFDTEVEQRQQNGYRLLLIPGEHH